MSVRHTHLFDRSAEFRFDAQRVEIASAVARIKELANTSTDLALNKSVSATSELENFEAANMVDGNAETSYKPDGSGPHEFEIDFGRLLWFNRLELDFASGGLPASMILYLSEDGITFDEIVNVPSVSADIEQNFTAVRCRYLKIVLTDSLESLEIIRLTLKGPVQYYDDRNLYLLTPPVLISSAEELLRSATTPAQTGIRFFWVIDGVAKYFDGAAWLNSNRTYDQASALTDLPPLTQKSWVRLGVVLCSLDGTARPTITSCTLNAGATAPAASEPELCVVSGYLRDATGDSLPGREITITASKAVGVLPVKRSVVTDEHGYFETTIEQGLRATFVIYPEGTSFVRNIPAAATADLEELT